MLVVIRDDTPALSHLDHVPELTAELNIPKVPPILKCTVGLRRLRCCEGHLLLKWLWLR